MRLGWFSTCWRAGAVVVVVDPPARVVVVDEPATVVAVVVGVGCADATEIGNENRIEHTATAVTAPATRDRVTPLPVRGREHLHLDCQEFMSAPECDGTPRL